MTIYRRPEGLIDPTPTVAQSLGAIIGTLGGKALSSYSQNAAINNIQKQLEAQGVSPALATLAAAQVGRTGGIGTPIANLIKNQQENTKLQNYYQQRWDLSPDQASNLAGTPTEIQKQEIKNLSAAQLLGNIGYGQQTSTPSDSIQGQPTLPGLPGLVLNEEIAANLPVKQPTSASSIDNSVSPRQTRIPTEEEILQATTINPDLGKQLGQFREIALKNQTEKEKRYYKFNEPIAAEANKRLQNLEIQDARFERLEELNKNYSNKFPSRLTAAWFSKDGQINKAGQALLADEVQEFVKLVQDNLSEAKDTFGARITNFDIDAFLRRLPSLLNSPEGRARVLRDLRLINQINRDHAAGILSIFRENGGTDQIAYSEVEDIYRERNKDKLANWRREFVQGNQVLNELPSASDNANRVIKNNKTGEYFRSDGSNWVPLSPEDLEQYRSNK